jgi:hypothetical protein
MTSNAWPIVLNQSSYKEFQNCHRLFGWHRLEHLTTPSRRSALEIGTATHSGLATYHAGGIDAEKEIAALVRPGLQAHVQTDTEQAEELAAYENEVEDIREAVKLPKAEQALWIALRKLRERAGPSSTFADKDLVEAEAIVTRVLLAYIEHYAESDEIWKPLNQEIECLVEVGPPGSNTWLRMRADNLSIAKGGLYVVDYKTAGRLDPRDLLKYELDVQITSYVYGLSKFLTEQARSADPLAEPIFIRGAIIDVLVKTTIPQFARELFTRTDEELAEFEAEWVEVLSEIRTRLDRVAAGEDWKIVFYRNTDNCFRYGTCPMRDVCLKDTPVRRALYDKREPDYVDTAQVELTAKHATHAKE